MTKLYDLPYDVRIRQKYLLLGISMGITFMFFVTALPFGYGGIIRLTITHMPMREYTLSEYIFISIASTIMFIFMVIACYWMWTSKSKPRKHPELENIGLKYDYEKVTKQ